MIFVRIKEGLTGLWKLHSVQKMMRVMCFFITYIAYFQREILTNFHKPQFWFAVTSDDDQMIHSVFTSSFLYQQINLPESVFWNASIGWATFGHFAFHSDASNAVWFIKTCISTSTFIYPWRMSTYLELRCILVAVAEVKRNRDQQGNIFFSFIYLLLTCYLYLPAKTWSRSSWEECTQ